MRWANRLPPLEDLWVKYFTSSKKISQLRKEFGDTAFEFQVRKIFNNKDDAIDWEAKVLTRLKVLNDPRWLNANIRCAKFSRSGPFSQKTRDKMSLAKRNRVVTPETCLKISQAKKGKVPWNKGKTGVFHHSQETIEKIRTSSAKAIWTEDRGRKISESKKGKPSPLKGRKGRQHDPLSKNKLSLARKGRTWYNNGIKNKISFEHPGEGWIKGRLYR